MVRDTNILNNRPPITVTRATEIPSILNSKQVAAFYIYDTTLPQPYFTSFLRLASQVRLEVPIYATPDVPEALTALGLPTSQSLPALVIIKDGGADTKIFHSSLEMASKFALSNVKDWVVSHKHPLVPELTAQNSMEILQGDKLIVMLALDTASELGPNL
jgi:hypothetical protein